VHVLASVARSSSAGTLTMLLPTRSSDSRPDGRLHGPRREQADLVDGRVDASDRRSDDGVTVDGRMRRHECPGEAVVARLRGVQTAQLVEVRVGGDHAEGGVRERVLGGRDDGTVAPVAAPTGPSATGPAVAASHAARPSAGPGRTVGSPRPRSKSPAPTTMGTTPAEVATPMPRSSQNRITPSQAASPNAEPPVSTSASSRATRRWGSRRAHSRVAGDPPRTSPEATVPAGKSTTVQPVAARASVQCPTRTPATSVITRAWTRSRESPGGAHGETRALTGSRAGRDG